MILSDLSVKRPVLAFVIGLLLITIGILSFDRLALREFPAIDPPIVSISTSYTGAAASVVETRITEVIEERIAGVSGIKSITSRSLNGASQITIEFNIDRDIDAAVNDVRDRVARILDDLPEEADAPDIARADSNEDVVIWFNLTSDRHDVAELTDYAQRFLVDRYSVLDGVARVRIGGEQAYALRIWLDRNALLARELTVADIENALRSENVELPAGTLESQDVLFRIRTERSFSSPDEFARLVVGRGPEGSLVRLADVARVERGTEEDRSFFRGNGVPMIGIGITRQSTANVIEVAQAAKTETLRINENLPQGMVLENSYDSSVFVEGAIDEVVKTLFMAIGFVVLVILVFLRSVRATLVPAVTVPISLMATFIAIHAFGFTINMFTLLALVLAIGMVVDDAIVVLENIDRRMHLGETRLVAAYLGSRQIAFAVVATTVVLIAVFVPIAFLQGNIGRLFSEFALTLAAAVTFSSLVALSVSPALASRILPRQAGVAATDAPGESHFFEGIQNAYERFLRFCLRIRSVWVVFFLGVCAGIYFLLNLLPQEFAPSEDRGAFFVMVSGPEGATHEYMKTYMDEIERRLEPYWESGEAERVLIRSPRGWGGVEDFNDGFAIIVLRPWGERRSAFEIMGEVRQKLSDLPGIRAFPVMRRGFGGRAEKPVQFVVGASSYAELAEWKGALETALQEDNPGLLGVEFDYEETRPFIGVDINYDLAAEVGVSVSTIGRTLETIMGSRKVTTYLSGGREYDVIVQGERDTLRTPNRIENIAVRSETTGALIPLANLVTLREYADSGALNRFNRIRAMTLSANLADDLTLDQALTHLENLVRERLPETAQIDYKGESAELRDSSGAVYLTLILGLLIVYLAMAAQFESFVHPFVILFSVPLAIAGGLLGLWFSGITLNLYAQIGLIMLVGLASKNGILIVEFANQLRDEGLEFEEALVKACRERLRPILMTAVTTVAGAIPLMISAGAGSETRVVIGTVILWGVSLATLLTLVIVPVAYSLITRHTQSPEARTRQLNKELEARSTSTIQT